MSNLILVLVPETVTHHGTKIIVRKSNLLFSIESMVAKSVFTLPINNHKEDAGIPVALEAYSPNLFIVGTELGALIGFDTRAGTKAVFRLQSDLASGRPILMLYIHTYMVCK